MKGTIFGKRKWVGLWLAVVSVMGYSIAAKLLNIPLELAGKVVWSIVSVYGVYVTGNAAAKIIKGGKYGQRPAGRDNHDTAG